MNTQQSKIQSPARPARWLNIAIYAVGVLALAAVAGAFTDSQDNAWSLLFVVSPLLMAVLLRSLGGDGWGDAGLRWRGAWPWYVYAALLFPLLSVATVALGAAAGAVTFPEDALRDGLMLFATFVVPTMLYSATEEWGWRGYLEPRLANLGLAPAGRHLAIGVLWATWHVPYILALGAEYTERNPWVFWPLFYAATIAMAYLWGTLRTATGSVWPAVIAHGVANASAYALLSEDVAVIDDVAVWAARPESWVMFTLIVAATAVTWARWGRRDVPR